MLRRATFSLIGMAALVAAMRASAQVAAFGTSADAKAMLEKVVAAMKADPAKTIALINKGEGGFKDRDIYPACAGPDGRTVAHPDPTRIGLVQRDLKDSTGRAYGAEFADATEGRISEVNYMFPRPGADRTPVPKVAFVTKVDGYVCLVGYYK